MPELHEIIAIVVVIALITIGWQLITGKPQSSRRAAPVARRGNRESDDRQLTRHEKGILRQAQSLVRAGRTRSAAQVYESINMHREAITLLEEGGFVEESARLLLRMGLPHRAAVIFARNELWDRAKEAYLYAQMSEDAAFCAERLGRWGEAGQLYEHSQKWDEAGRCFRQAGQFHRSAKCYLRSGKVSEEVAQAYANLFRELGESPTPELEAFEWTYLVDWLGEGNFDEAIAKVVIERGSASEIILEQVMRSSLDSAARMIGLVEEGTILELISKISYGNDSAESLAKALLIAKEYFQAGKIFEQLEQFTQAAACFEKALEWRRAAYCHERAGNPEAARKATAKSENESAPPPKQSKGVAGAFSLNLLTEMPDEQAPEAGKEKIEETKIFPIVSATARPPVKAPPPMKVPAAASPIRRSGTGRSLQKPKVALGSASRELAHPAFANAELFSELDDSQKGAIWYIGRSHEFRDGHSLLDYDAEPPGLFVIISGTARCYRRSEQGELKLDLVTTGESIGEFWLLTGHPSSVKFQAEGQVTCRVVARQDFIRLLDSDGHLARKIYKRFTQKLLKKLFLQESSESSDPVLQKSS